MASQNKLSTFKCRTSSTMTACTKNHLGAWPLSMLEPIKCMTPTIDTFLTF